MKSWERVMLYSMFAAMMTVTLMGAKTRTQKLIRAEKIEIVDANGEIRIVLSTESEAGSLVVSGHQGSITVGVGEEGTGIAVIDANQVPRLTAGFTGMGVAGIGVYDGRATPMISLAATATGQPVVRVVDSSGNSLFTVPKE